MRAVWRRLRAADLPREEHALAVRLLHGSLYVGAFLCHIHVLPPGSACCPHPACSVGAARPPLDDLGHAFLTCPAVAPAVDWVCRVFAAASGGPQPPSCPRVFWVMRPASGHQAACCAFCGLDCALPACMPSGSCVHAAHSLGSLLMLQLCVAP